MAQIKQIGPGRKTSGTIDGITYVTRNGKTYVRSTPTMPIRAYRTLAALKRQAIFKMVQMHMKYHLRTIRQTFTPKGNGSAVNRYYSVNGKALTKALEALADRLVAGEDITLTEVEAAIAAYATEHPEAIRIGKLSACRETQTAWDADVNYDCEYDVTNPEYRFAVQEQDGERLYHYDHTCRGWQHHGYQWWQWFKRFKR